VVMGFWLSHWPSGPSTEGPGRGKGEGGREEKKGLVI